MSEICSRSSDPILERAEGKEIVDCSHCGYAHVRPIPTLEQLRGLYTEKFYGQDKPDYFRRMEEDIEWWTMVYEGRYEKELYRFCIRHQVGREIVLYGRKR